MIFLFEQFPYDPDLLKTVLPKQGTGYRPYVQRGSGNTQCVDAIGYIYNQDIESKDPTDKIVFILPKVFVEEGSRAFGVDIDPKGKDVFARQYANAEEKAEKLKDSILAKHTDFFSELSLWVCSSISVYHENNPSTNDVCTPSPRAEDFSSGVATPTLIDVKNAMERFYEENKSLFVFVSKNTHSGNNRIDWRRTMRKMPFIQDEAPVYMELVNKKKVFDLDDRLIVLYFSAMNYIHETFGFKMPKSEFYAPMRVNEFRRLLGHKGLMELRRIKHKYFADKFLRLYNIMKAFFEWGGNFRASDFSSEYLLTNKYNNVFEHMIDVLVGDNSEKIQSMKNLKDGKIIDHLYKEDSLIFSSGDSEKIWHIGDSKYYKDSTDLGPESIAKQYTYAKNIIQDFFSPEYFKLSEDKRVPLSPHESVRYRDELTEGYSVTPNFFIRGDVEKDNPLDIPDVKHSISDAIEEDDMWNRRNRHFENRLFDRDTLLLQVYNVNFLYVLKAFTAKNSSLREEFKKTAREKFRSNFLTLLNSRYYFWILWVDDKCMEKLKGVDLKREFLGIENPGKLEAFVYLYSRKLNGKIFRTSPSADYLILALERTCVDCEDAEFRTIRDSIKGDCEVFLAHPKEIWNAADIGNAEGCVREPELKRPN